MRLTLALVASQFLPVYGVETTADPSAVKDQELCDWAAYLSRYPDLSAHGTLTEAQAEIHYETIGKAQGKQCTKEFQLNGLELFKLRNSSCSQAIDFEHAFILQKQNIQNEPPKVKPGKLKAVDIGAGTTGTSFLFGVVCGSLHLRGYHWTSSCSTSSGRSNPFASWWDYIVRCVQNAPHNGYHWTRSCSQSNPLAIWWAYLIHCVQNAPQNKDSSGCKSDAAVEKLDYELKRVLAEVDLLMDSPMDTIYAHYASYMKDALTFMTIRDPMQWALKRHSEHPLEPLMCNPEVYALGHAYHPYDVISCLKSTEFVHQAIVVEKNTSRSAEGYIAMNTYNAATARNLHIMCLWDAPPEETEPEVLAAWEKFSNSS